MKASNITAYVEEEASLHPWVVVFVVLLFLWVIGCTMKRLEEIYTPIRWCIKCVTCGACRN